MSFKAMVWIQDLILSPRRRRRSMTICLVPQDIFLLSSSPCTITLVSPSSFTYVKENTAGEEEEGEEEP